jgi:hypothetical protein
MGVELPTLITLVVGFATVSLVAEMGNRITGLEQRGT